MCFVGLGSRDTEQLRTHKTPASILEVVGLLNEGEHNFRCLPSNWQLLNIRPEYELEFSIK